MNFYSQLGTASFVVMFVVAALYAMYKRPGSPTLDKVKVPGGIWIVAAIVLGVVALFAMLLMQDPLKH